MGYISVPDVDAAVATAQQNGATVTMPATDMPEVGRFAVLTDTVGARFGLVKASNGDDADKPVPTAGDIVWMEHWAKNGKQSTTCAAAIAAVAGYELQTTKMGKADYAIASAGGVPRMGFAKAARAADGGRFVPYAVVADVDATVKAATKAHGKVVTKPTDVPNVGRIAVIADPAGGTIGVMTMSPMPAPGAGEAPATDAAAPTSGEGQR
jgi:predicted enzyme related to lactoylglutathione lyase